MKKKFVMLLLASMVLTGCANTAESVSSNTAAPSQQVAQSPIDAVTPVTFEGTVMENVDKVEIPDYKDIQVSVPVFVLPQEEITAHIQQEYANLVYQTDAFVYEDTDKDTVEAGDVVLMDFEGKVDGALFDGGSAKDTHLEIGSGSFIDGFEDGCIGMKTGETKDISVQFPADYPNESLAGKDAIFSVTVKKIQTRAIPEMTDDIVKGFGIDVATVADFTKGITSNLTSQLLLKNETEKITAIEDALVEQIDATPSKESIQKITDKILSTYQQEADEHGESLEDYFTTHMGTPLEDYKKDCELTAKDMAKKIMIFEAIAKKEGIFVSKEAIQRQAENDYQGMGYASVDEYMENVDKEALYDFILENAVIGAIEDKLSITQQESQNMPLE